MADRIDHVTEARRLLPARGEGMLPTHIALAHVHATLALVEQQRIANLIALGQFRVGVDDLPHLRHLAVEPAGENDLQPVAEIKEALGLS